jgi:hypothetical protein
VAKVSKKITKSPATKRTTSKQSGTVRSSDTKTPSRGVFIGVQSRGVFALPADIRKRHHLDKPGAQLLVIEREDGVLELHPQLAVPADQKWFWTKEWQTMEAEASEDIVERRVSRSDSSEELFDDLDALRKGN